MPMLTERCGLEWVEEGEVVLQESIIQSMWAGCGVLTRYLTNRRQVVVKQIDIEKLRGDTSLGMRRKLRCVV